jgi:hypothetical protein
VIGDRAWYQRIMRAALATMCVVSLWIVSAGCGDKEPATTNPTSSPSTADSEGDEDSEAAGSSGPGESETGSPTTSGGSQGTTDGATTEAATSQGATSDVTGMVETTGGFIVPPDGGDGGDECDNWAQDCPRGEKCAAFADNGGNAWNATKCVLVPEDADQPGDKCTVEGSAVSGLDSCDLGAMCWDVDPNTQEGVCVGLCTGSPDAPVCDSEFSCFVSNEGILNLCLPICDPLAQDCPGDDLCIPNPQGQNAFSCVLDASGDEGQAFDPCEFINACDPGLFCANPANATECSPDAIGCCLPFCDLEMPAPCPGANQECLAWFEMGTAPPGLEAVGFCGLPG